MAILRAEECGLYDGRQIFDVLAETQTDLAGDRDGLTAYGTHKLNLTTPGCMAYVIDEGKVYCRTTTAWEAAE